MINFDKGTIFLAFIFAFASATINIANAQLIADSYADPKLPSEAEIKAEIKAEFDEAKARYKAAIDKIFNTEPTGWEDEFGLWFTIVRENTVLKTSAIDKALDVLVSPSDLNIAALKSLGINMKELEIKVLELSCRHSVLGGLYDIGVGGWIGLGSIGTIGSLVAICYALKELFVHNAVGFAVSTGVAGTLAACFFSCITFVFIYQLRQTPWWKKTSRLKKLEILRGLLKKVNKKKVSPKKASADKVSVVGEKASTEKEGLTEEVSPATA